MSSADPVAFPVQRAALQARARPDVRGAIAQAAAKTGVDFGYLVGQAKLESSMDPSARARTSSAAGLYQFIDNTWLETMDRHGARLGFANAASAIEMRGGRARVTDPAQRDAIMAMRFDPQVAALMAGALASDNRAALTPVLGREPAPAELYMAHFLGSDGAAKFLTALQRSPDMAAASLLPKAAGANRTIFYTPGGSPRSVQGVMALFERKMSAAMEGGLANGPPPVFSPYQSAGLSFGANSYTAPSSGIPAFGASAGKLPAMPSLAAQTQRVSMAEVVRGSFRDAAGISTQASSRISRAYTKLEAFGL